MLTTLSGALCQCGINQKQNSRGDGRIDPAWQMHEEVRRKRRWSQEPWALDGLPPTTLANARSLAGQIMADAKRGRTAAIVEVLDSEDIDAQTGALLLAAGDLANGNTAVMLCAKNGHAGCCRLLLARGADPQAKNRHGQTAVDIAKAANHMDVVDVLHEYW